VNQQDLQQNPDDPIQLIRDAWLENGDHLDELVTQLTRGVMVVPFVGAGLSADLGGFGFPLWSRFLHNQAKLCGKSAEVANLLQRELYEDAADLLLQARGLANFHGAIENTYGSAKLQGRKIQGAVTHLPRLAQGPVVTTNWDPVLERVFLEAGREFERCVWGAQVDSISRAIQDDVRFLLKIHGDASERTNRVFTKTDYDQYYGPRGSPAMLPLPASLRQLFTGKRLLFLGCGLNRDRTMEVLRQIAEDGSVAWHFAILEKPESETQVYYDRIKFLGDCNIRAIWYPHGRHDLLQPLLAFLALQTPKLPDAGPKLTLISPARRLGGRPIRNELELLTPDRRATDLVGREQDLEDLWTWLHSKRPISIRTITGRAGAGKTRIAIELIDRLEVKEPGTWHAGFLSGEELRRFAQLQNLSAWKWPEPALLVLDYAGAHTEPLRHWLKELNLNPAEGVAGSVGA